MVQSGQSSRVRASGQKLKVAKDEQRSDDGQRLTYEYIAEKSYVSVSRVKAFFRGERVYRDNALAICRVLGVKLEDVVEFSELDSSIEISEPEQATSIKWRAVCRAMLDAQNQRSLTTNPLTRNDGMEFEQDEIYVPLGLVDRPKREKLKDNDSPEQGSKLYEPTEEETKITKKYQNDEFFEQVLKRGHEQGNSKGRRLAIIGEPGAGKSTFQQKIADWVLNKTEADVPILISLGAIGNKSLNHYLMEDWLRDAAQDPEAAPEEWKASLRQQLKSGRVWLLLDGADEMAVDSPLDISRNSQATSGTKFPQLSSVGELLPNSTVESEVKEVAVNNELK